MLISVVKELGDDVHCVTVSSRKSMGIRVESECHGRMPREVRDDLDRNIGRERKGRKGMAKIMEPDPRYLYSFKCTVKGFTDRVRVKR